jgi:sarcosine oxidase
MPDFDVAVIGLGAMGAATLYQLAKLDVKAVGIDRYDPPHTFGSSHGETRITRLAVGEGKDYVPLALASHRIWRELEAETGEALLEQCGALIMASGDKNSHHGKADFVTRCIRAAEAFGIRHEVLGASDIVERFPQLIGLKGDERAYYEPEGGFVRPERCIAAQITQARVLGAEVIVNRTVNSFRQSGAQVLIDTDLGEISAAKAVIAAGPWIGDLVGPAVGNILTVNRQVLHWFEIDPDVAATANWPVTIWMHGSGDTDYFYSFPPSAEEGSIKVATEQYEKATTADEIGRSVAAQEVASMYEDHVRGRIDGVSPVAVKSATCAYTVTPDLGFVIDTLPDSPSIMMISACSGHGFKHSAAIGQAVAQKISSGTNTISLLPFQLARFTATQNAKGSL